MPANVAEIEEAAGRLRNAPPSEVAAWAMRRFGNRLSIASSFSVEDCVLIDLAVKAAPGEVRVFALDTGRLPDETYLTAERVRMKYGLEISWFFPERAAVENLIRSKGLYSFRDSLDDRHACCGIRKVEPLARALADREAWMTGLRNEQSVTRTDTAEVEVDRAHGNIVKVSPLVRWTM
jgi:phosphoadenosine phosphosulfate reductase